MYARKFNKIVYHIRNLQKNRKLSSFYTNFTPLKLEKCSNLLLKLDKFVNLNTTNPNNTSHKRLFSTTEFDSNTFEKVCEETLHKLADYFEDLIANDPKLAKGDVSYGAGVLTIELENLGTYVINRQSPNRQIWLSSPISGPKRYDYITVENSWVYKHDGQKLQDLLEKEFEDILGRKVFIPIL
ncbi:hypothetical protein ABEB36_012451 [Hypothenemus hampei]|uniref:ferroxidase n=1 Tax=Hypothenemus hampei TaxID=57062 RepID=A0ABD1EBA1_HYPHA